MACPPIEPFTTPATRTAPVFASELTGSRVARYVPCARARTMINTLCQQVTTTTPDTPPVCGEGSNRSRVLTRYPHPGSPSFKTH